MYKIIGSDIIANRGSFLSRQFHLQNTPSQTTRDILIRQWKNLIHGAS